MFIHVIHLFIPIIHLFIHIIHCLFLFQGEMAFAVNVIGKFIIPPNWTEEPELATCSFAAAAPETAPVAPKHAPELAPAKQTTCGESFCQTPSCEFDVSRIDSFFFCHYCHSMVLIFVLYLLFQNSDICFLF